LIYKDKILKCNHYRDAGKVFSAARPTASFLGAAGTCLSPAKELQSAGATIKLDAH